MFTNIFSQRIPGQQLFFVVITKKYLKFHTSLESAYCRVSRVVFLGMTLQLPLVTLFSMYSNRGEDRLNCCAAGRSRVEPRVPVRTVFPRHAVHRSGFGHTADASEIATERESTLVSTREPVQRGSHSGAEFVARFSGEHKNHTRASQAIARLAQTRLGTFANPTANEYLTLVQRDRKKKMKNKK